MSDFGSIRKKHEQSDELNITPLIDIIFILLIFFIVTTTFVKEMKLDIKRPGASSGEITDSKSIRITIEKNRDINIDGKPVNSWMVQSYISDLLAKNRDRAILLIADKRVETGFLVEVADSCRLGGGKNIAIDVEKKND